MLRAAVNSVINNPSRSCDYVFVERTLGVREDDIMGLILSGLFQAEKDNLEADRELALIFWTSNSSHLDLSVPERQVLGQRWSLLAHLAPAKASCKVRISRVGWSIDGQHVLVYVGVRSPLPKAVLLELQRGEGGWEAVREWAVTETIVLD